MAMNPDAEQFASEILDIFVNHFSRRAQGVLRLQNFTWLWPQRGHTSSDFKLGMLYAIEQGWIELEAPDRYCLTQEGFDAA